MAVIVRHAGLSDVPALVDLMQEFYAESGFPLDRTWAARSFTTLLANPSLGAAWLMTLDGHIAGHVVLAVRFAMEFGGTSAYVDDLFVRPGFRRRGAATAGLNALVDECRQRDCRSLHVEVDPDNAAAVTLYRRFGLEPHADRRAHLNKTFDWSIPPRPGDRTDA